jgi:hypothetical protein
MKWPSSERVLRVSPKSGSGAEGPNDAKRAGREGLRAERRALACKTEPTRELIAGTLREQSDGFAL